MALILNIDNAINAASICLAKDETPLVFEENTGKNQSAAWLHTAIKDATAKAGVRLAEIDAIAVSNGPGSYTGLRIGLSAAKGLCYALKKPLICLNTLTIMAFAVKELAEGLICPMIDARRMEVFTALYDNQLNIIKEPEAVILTPESYFDILTNHKIVFTGDGIGKFQSMAQNPNASFTNGNVNALSMLTLSSKRFSEILFDDLAYTEPFYLKGIYTK